MSFWDNIGNGIDELAKAGEKVNGVLERADTLLRTGDSIARSVASRLRNGGVITDESGYTSESVDVDFDALLTTPIDNYCLIPMADYQLRKHMMLSKMNRDITLFAVTGDSVSGISNKITPELYNYDYSYTDNNDYVKQYQRSAKDTTTRVGWKNDNIQNYANHNQIYGQTINVYPDDDDAGTMEFTESEKWETYEENRNPNSILKKTKDLFRCRKINTIISKFHTDADKLDLYSNTESATSAYGLSHGRNLLTYDAERNGISYYRNGYDNPYCRVWTHHHQYSEQRSRMIRPFSIEDEYGNSVTRPNQDLHKWQNFPNGHYDVETSVWNPDTIEMSEENQKKLGLGILTHGVSLLTKGGSLKKGAWQTNTKSIDWGWKDKGAEGWAMSVINRDTGTVNIAPKYLGGAERNVHTKDCMFSIENLAWQGYDPYSFERALSWEQRGPFGGRIMWFPPYGLSFNEDTTVTWNEHSFIGRGENVFTYTNTARSGTLSFMMVVDHPSILDYATWHDNKPQDTDVLRFLAGCDGGSADNGPYGGNGNVGLSSYAKPTPLTDEYLKEEITPEPVKPNAVEKPTNEQPQPDTPTPDEEVELSFYVFYPNNYSGAFDMYGKEKAFDRVDPIAYLLFGDGTQWKCDDSKNGANITKSKSLDISFSDFAQNKNMGRGYEMFQGSKTTGTQDDEKNYILGTGNPKGYDKKGKTYVVNLDKKYYYRIDGKYDGSIQYSSVENTFGQNFKAENRKDTYSFGLNFNPEKVKTVMGNNSEYVYSLAEVACLFGNDERIKKIKSNCSFDLSGFTNEKFEERVNKLKEYISKDGAWKITEINGYGYSNSHDKNDLIVTYNGKKMKLYEARNEFLSIQRCNTAIEWFKEQYSRLPGEGSAYIKVGEMKHEPGVDAKSESVSAETAKKWRSAKIVIKLKKRQTEETADLEQKEDNETIASTDYAKLDPTEQSKYEPAYYDYNNEKTISVEEYNNLKDEEKELCKVVTYRLKNKEDKQPVDKGGYEEFTDFKKVEKDQKTNTQLYVNVNETDVDKKERRWYYDSSSQQMKVWEPEKTMRSTYKWNSGEVGPDEYDHVVEDNNSLRYDQEYHFFKQLHSKHPDVFASLVDKLQYFDPAFHSMTPEGFMGRLNFLHQCTRQGDTRTTGDRNGYMANNLAFGRPPFCILRLGDFYYQKIVIRNINITYDPLVLDLNNEGIGVVPLIANVTISFNFIGGGDLSGPVRRLQNAMSFNYYANGRLYDNRADRVEYKDKNNNESWETMQRDVDWERSYFHHVKMSK